MLAGPLSVTLVLACVLIRLAGLNRYSPVFDLGKPCHAADTKSIIMMRSWLPVSGGPESRTNPENKKRDALESDDGIESRPMGMVMEAGNWLFSGVVFVDIRDRPRCKRGC